MIPKRIHYCWFGRGQKPELAVKCIDSWKKILPEYEIKEWNEDNFDLNLYKYVREAYDSRKFAFVTDVVRLYALYNEGGVYMDTDVEILKPIDALLGYEAVSGFETETRIPTGLMASEAGSHIIKELLDEYDGIRFIRKDGSLDLTTNVTRITDTLLNHGLVQNNTLQSPGGFTLFPADYLCPKSYVDGKIYLTENTLCIHHFSGSWKSDEDIDAYKYKEILKGYFGEKAAGYVGKFFAICKHRSFKAALLICLAWSKR